MTTKLANCHVLLVEDDEELISLLDRAFHVAGAVQPLHFVREAAQAKAYLAGDAPYEDREAHPNPTLILINMDMPGGKAFEFLRWLRRSAPVRLIPVVGLGRIDRQAIISRAYAAGANSFLMVPSEVEAFVDLIRSVRRYWMVLNRKPYDENHAASVPARARRSGSNGGSH